MSQKETEQNFHFNDTAIIERIRFLLDVNHWTIYRLAKESGLSYSSINNIFVRNTCPTILTLEKICYAFHISLSEFFAFDTNPTKPDKLTEKEADLLSKYRSLSASDQKRLDTFLSNL